MTHTRGSATGGGAAGTSETLAFTARRRWRNTLAVYSRLRKGWRVEEQDARFRRHIVKSGRA